VETVFFDVDTQLDFLLPSGALPVPGAEDLVKPLTELTRFANAHRIQIISTADAHTENDAEFKKWKPHCVAGTIGQRKIASTLLSRPIVLGSAAGALEQSASRLKDASQIIVEKQMLDCFTNPNLRLLLDLLEADRYVVYGVVTEYCVRCAAFGLLDAGARVELVTDAIRSLQPADERETIESFQAQGGKLTTVAAATA